MRPELSVGAALPPAGRQRRGSGSPGGWHICVAWATMPGWLVMTVGPRCCGGPCPFWTGSGPRDARMGAPCRPRCDPGCCRGRALGRRAAAAGPGRVDERCRLRAGGVGPGHGSADPAEVRENMQQNIQRLQREGRLREPGPKAPAAARTPTPAARRLERHLSRSHPFQGHEHPPVQACFHRRGDGPRRAVGPAPPAAAGGTRDRQRILYRRVLCPLGGPGRAAAQAEDRRRVGPWSWPDR